MGKGALFVEKFRVGVNRMNHKDAPIVVCLRKIVDVSPNTMKTVDL